MLLPSKSFTGCKAKPRPYFHTFGATSVSLTATQSKQKSASFHISIGSGTAFLLSFSNSLFIVNLSLDVEIVTILTHAVDDDIAYLLAYNLGIGMRCACCAMIAKIKNMAPFGKRVGICHYGIGVDR